MKLKPLVVMVALSLATVPASAEKHARKKVHLHAPTIETPESKYPPSDPYAVWVAGTYVGRDPDPRVRAEMIRQFDHNFDNR